MGWSFKFTNWQFHFGMKCWSKVQLSSDLAQICQVNVFGQVQVFELLFHFVQGPVKTEKTNKKRWGKHKIRKLDQIRETWSFTMARSKHDFANKTYFQIRGGSSLFQLWIWGNTFATQETLNPGTGYSGVVMNSLWILWSKSIHWCFWGCPFRALLSHQGLDEVKHRHPLRLGTSACKEQYERCSFPLGITVFLFLEVMWITLPLRKCLAFGGDLAAVQLQKW